MAELDAARILRQFYRLVGTESADPRLVRQGEAVDDVAYEALTEGVRAAQFWMLDNGYQGWRMRSATVITWSGTDEADGGRYTALPADFLRLYGTIKPGRSALVQADGTRWGSQILADKDDERGDHYYLRDEQLWLTRAARPVTGLYLDYHYEHPVWSASVTIDFPERMRGIIAPTAAYYAMDQNWLPGDQALETKIANALMKAQHLVRKYVRQTKEPRRFKKSPRIANHW